MDEGAARALERAARSAGDQLVVALNTVKNESPRQAKRWTRAVGEVMSEIYNKLLAPIWVDHPALRPPWAKFKEDAPRRTTKRPTRPRAKAKPKARRVSPR